MPYLAAAGQAITVIRRAAWATAASAAVLIAVTAHRQDETLRQVVAELGRLREVASRMQGAISAMSEAHEAALHAVAAKGFEVGYDARGAEEARARVTRLR